MRHRRIGCTSPQQILCCIQDYSLQRRTIKLQPLRSSENQRLGLSHLAALPHCISQHCFSRSTGQTRSPKNCQEKRAVPKAFRSARYCEGSGQAGAYHRDEIRNIRARLEPSLHQSDQFPLLASGGEAAMVEMAPVEKAVPMCYTENTTFAGYACGVDASLSVPTGPENVPQHYLQPVALYLGRAAQV